MRQRFIWVDGRGLVEVPADYKPKPRVFHIAGRNTQPFVSFADGKVYSCHRRYEAEAKARGYEIVGNEKGPFDRPDLPTLPPVEDSLFQAAAQIGVDID